MERYQLSQDFQERQLQLLQKKYGGAKKAMQAALTIQRAYRRYSMAKKFADLTAHAKAEKRVSRRLEVGTQQASVPSAPATDPPLRKKSSSPVDRTDGSTKAVQQQKQRHNHHYHHHHYHPHHANHRRQIYIQHYNNMVQCPVVSDWRQQAAAVVNTTSSTSSTPKSIRSANSSEVTVQFRPQQAEDQPEESQHSPMQPADTNDPSSSYPELQSFPLDESSIYPYNYQQNLQTNQVPPPRVSSASSVDERKIVSNGGAPNVPKRTVARLSSTEEKRPKKSSSISQHHSSPQMVANGAPRGVKSPNVVGNDVLKRQHSASGYRIVADVSSSYTVSEVIRKRHYRTGLNIFNNKPEKGIAYLIRKGFLENSPQAVARFLVTRKGLSKQMIGEYLGNLNYQFNMATLNCFAMEMDLSGMQIDTALRKFQTYFRMPGEAQKIERIVEVFSARYCQCNSDIVAKFHSTESIFILAFAIILLNTDLHTPNLKPEKRMKLDDFVRNLRGIDDGHDVDYDLLSGIYERIRAQEFRPGSDHVTQVMKVQQTIVAKCPNLAVPHRRLVCYCRLYEVHDPFKKEKPGVHQREVFLFNDILVITKIHSRKKNSVTYAFRQSYLLAGMMVSLFETQYYPYGIKISQKWDKKVVLMLNARNEHDRSKFVEDLKESVAEMDEMEALRLEAELEKHRFSSVNENRDSGINEASSTNVTELSAGGASSSSTLKSKLSPGVPGKQPSPSSILNNNNNNNNNNTVTVNGNGVVLRRSAINNSLLDLSEATAEKMTRRGSVGSLDSGMSVSFQSNSVGSFYIGNGAGMNHHGSQYPHHHQCGRMMGNEESLARQDRTSARTSSTRK